MKKFIYKYRNILASVGGLLTSLGSAWALIDFSTFSFSNPNDCFKLFVLALPALGGIFSQFNITPPKDGI